MAHVPGSTAPYWERIVPGMVLAEATWVMGAKASTVAVGATKLTVTAVVREAVL